MVEVNYQQQVIRPMQEAMSGYATGVGLKQNREQHAANLEATQAQAALLEQQQQKLIQEQEAAKATQTQLVDLGMKVRNGTWTPEDFLSLQVSNPAISEHMATAFEGMNDQKKKNTVKTIQKMAIALETDPEQAKLMMEEEAQAAENSGNAHGAASLRAQLKALDFAPEAIKTALLSQLAAAMPNDEFKNFASTLSPEPEKAVTDFGKIRQDIQNGLMTEEEGDALIENAIQAKAADLGLTEAQIQQALANASKSKAETSKLQSDEGDKEARYLTREEKEAAGYDADDVVQRKPNGDDQVRARSGDQYSGGEIKKFRQDATTYLALRGALNEYRNSVNEHGNIRLTGLGRPEVARLDSLRRNVQMQLKGLLNLGVLSRDDYAKLDDMIPAATDWKAKFTSDEAIKEKLKQMDNEIERRISAVPDFIREEAEQMMADSPGMSTNPDEDNPNEPSLPPNTRLVE